MKPIREWSKRKKVVCIIIAAILVLLIFASTSMLWSYQIANIALKIACSERDKLKPLNYAEITAGVEYLAEDVVYDSAYGNNKMDILAPSDTTELLPLVIYFHGGYYVGGDKKAKEIYCKTVANGGYVVFNVNYELAPKSSHPYIAIQANEAVKYIVENAEKYHADATRVFIGGDSAGGHLSGMLGAIYTNPTLAQQVGITPALSADSLKGLILLCGFYDMLSLRETGFPLLNEAMWMLTGKKDYENYDRVQELCTVNNVTADYPDTYLLCGGADPLYAQNEQMRDKLTELGVDVTAVLPKDGLIPLLHEYQTFFDLDEATEAMAILHEFLAEKSK